MIDEEERIGLGNWLYLSRTIKGVNTLTPEAATTTGREVERD